MVQLMFHFPLTALCGNFFMFDQFKLMYSEEMYYMIMIVMFLHLTFYKMCFKNTCIQNSKGGMLYRHTECFFLQAVPSPPTSFFSFRLK